MTTMNAKPRKTSHAIVQPREWNAQDGQNPQMASTSEAVHDPASHLAEVASVLLIAAIPTSYQLGDDFRGL